MEKRGDGVRAIDRRGCRRGSNGFQEARSSRHSNHFPTRALKRELNPSREISTSLGDQRSLVRVLSPRFAAHCIAVKPFPLSCSRFQHAGISHFAGNRRHSLLMILFCKTSLAAPSADDDPATGTVNGSS
jgi:hypothetical protein